MLLESDLLVLPVREEDRGKRKDILAVLRFCYFKSAKMSKSFIHYAAQTWYMHASMTR